LKGKAYYPDRELTRRIIGAAIEVHNYWGPGLYEEIYERSLFHELQSKNILVEKQVQVPLYYKDLKIGEDLRLDLLVERRIIIEIKSVKELLPIHKSQLLTYLKLTNCQIGLLINFNVNTLTDGIKRVIN
jgi:GxxExxY protein